MPSERENEKASKSTMDSELSSIFQRVKTYTDRLGLYNSFEPRFNHGNTVVPKNEYATVNFGSSEIIINPSIEPANLLQEYAASFMAFYQVPAFLVESARKYEGRESSVLRVDSGTVIDEIIGKSLLLKGICKSVERHVMDDLGDTKQYDFSSLVKELVEDIIVDAKSIRDMGESERRRISLDRTEHGGVVEGYTLADRVFKKMRDSPEHPYIDHLLRASLIVASEAVGQGRTFDEQFRTLWNGGKGAPSIDQILVMARYQDVMMYNGEKYKPYREAMVQTKRDIYTLMGMRETIFASEMLPKISELQNNAIKAAVDVKLMGEIGDMMNKLGKDEEKLIDSKTKGEIRSMLNGISDDVTSPNIQKVRRLYNK